MPSLHSLLARGCLLALAVGPVYALSQTPVGSTSAAASIFHHRCAPCHGENGEGVSSVISVAGPPLLAVHDPGRVVTAVEVGPGRMPSFAHALSIEEIH